MAEWKGGLHEFWIKFASHYKIVFAFTNSLELPFFKIILAFYAPNPPWL